MWKKSCILLLAVALCGCSEGQKDENSRKECKDGPIGTTYYVGYNELCCGGHGVPENDLNCGYCGNACLNGNHCVKGLCTCETTGTFCNLACTELGCVVPTCNPPQIACGGACADINNDVNNCGSCGVICPGDTSNHVSNKSCRNKQCYQVCESGWSNADGNLDNGCEQQSVSVCGNSIVESGEQCDGLKLNDMTCEMLMGTGSTGTLSCKPDCSGFDTSNCSAPTTCHNQNLDANEVCDGELNRGETCESELGQGSTGTLHCNNNCTGFVTTECTKPTTCGNTQLDTNEVCDGNLLNGNTCEKVVGIGSTGTLRCNDNCSDFDKTGCTAAAVCGNNQLETGESCDGNNFNGASCESIVGHGSVGTLVCKQCKISTESCSSASTCGNNKIDGNDKCDGTDLANATCATVVGAGSMGTLRCKENCTGYDISGCTAAAQCGNGVIEAGEVCDGIKLNDHTCATVVGAGSTGTLKCNQTCTDFVTTECSVSTTCGNNTIEYGEVCDTTNLLGATCAIKVGPGSVGHILCGHDCTYLNLSGCSAATQCGNGTINPGEVCESGNLNGATCATVVGQGSTGTLKCGDGCKHFDISGCSNSTYCGNGSIGENEVCDGNNLAGRTCADIKGYGSKGVLKCKENCMGFDTSMCTEPITCGNGKLDPGEYCDGNMLNGATCTALVGFGSTGSPTCNSTCSGVSTTSCSAAVTCGNGKIDTGEVCDGILLNGKTCEQQVGHGSTGTPGCNSSCTGYTNGTCSPEVLCGNSKLDNGEQCDKTLLNGATCASVVGTGSTGVLLCDSNCKFDTTNCKAPATCGNTRLDNNEECDGQVFVNGIKDCNTYNPSIYKSGTLGCSSNCQADTSACVKYCGDNQVTDYAQSVHVGEVCDGTNLNNQTCATQVGAGSTGTLKCAADCKSFNTHQCTAAAYCGDGKVNNGEACDDKQFASGSDSCAIYSNVYASGKLKCLSNCTVDVSACTKKPYCGDKIVNNDELCDGTNFKNSKTSCTDWDSSKYTSGSVICNSDCTINYSQCVAKPVSTCNNNNLDTGEICDGNKFYNNITCATYDPERFSGGTLRCNNCQIDDSGCTLKPVCGNGTIDSGEECDTNTFTNQNCSNYDPTLYQSGLLTCNNCRINTSSCVKYCGNNTVDKSVGEVCDGSNLDGKTCATQMGNGYTGALRCSSNCKSFNTNSCNAPSLPYCGDGVVNQATEFCDKTDFLDDNCTYWNSVAYKGGKMKCTNNCELDESGCIPADVKICGDGIVNQIDELCDINDFYGGSAACADWNSKYGAGNVSCDNNCQVVFNNCVLKADMNCGNGQIQDDEECDQSDMLFTNCTDLDPRYSGGLLGCSTSCTLTTDNCILHRCGDDILGSQEYCDGSLFDPDLNTCQKINSNYVGGTLSCNNCEIDDSQCISNITPNWCSFYWLDTDTLLGYGRIWLPDGMTVNDVTAYMACTTDLSIPVKNWEIAAYASHNPGCQNCGANQEFMTDSTFAGYPGTNYCTFIFKFSDTNMFACHPVQNGNADPIRLDANTRLESGTPRTFQPKPCDSSVLAQCVGREIQVCMDDVWQHYETCDATKTCNASTPSCD